MTVPEFRLRGLGRVCVFALTLGIRARGRIPAWSAPRSKEASLALARAAGFRSVRTEVCHYVGAARVPGRGVRRQLTLPEVPNGPGEIGIT